MNHFNQSFIHGACKNKSITSFLIVINRYIEFYENTISKRCIPYKGIKHTTYNLKLICSYIPELYNINNIDINNWLSHPGKRYKSDVINMRLIDFTKHFTSNDLISLPFIFNPICDKSGIYKLSCQVDSKLDFTMGITDKLNFHERIRNRTYKSCFYLDDLIWSPSHLSLSSEGEFHLNDMNQKPVHKKKMYMILPYPNSVPYFKLSIIYDSYQQEVYYYKNNILMTKQQVSFPEDSDMVPFIHIKHNKTYSNYKSQINNKIIRFC